VRATIGVAGERVGAATDFASKCATASFNSISHLAGAVFAAIGTVIMVRLHRDAWKIVAVSVFGATLVFLRCVDDHHSARPGSLRKLDHCAIYLLIAGTYTPFCLVTLRGPLGWTFIG
jgi:hemolysin III